MGYIKKVSVPRSSAPLQAVNMRKALDLIHAEVMISEIIGHYVDNIQSTGSKTHKCLCPFHNDKNNPSMTLSDDKGLYHCFTCNKGGDTVQFVQEMEIITFPEAVLKVLEIAEPSIGSVKALWLESEGAEGGRKYTKQELEFYKQKERINEALNKAALFYSAQLIQNPRAGGARNHLIGRKVTPESIYKFGIGYAPSAAAAAMAAAKGLPCGGTLSANLTRQGFTVDELVSAGLSMISTNNFNTSSSTGSSTSTSTSSSSSTVIGDSAGKNGSNSVELYDRFRDRLMVPIRSPQGQVLGFGGRSLGTVQNTTRSNPKYLNSPETAVFKKNQVRKSWSVEGCISIRYRCALDVRLVFRGLYMCAITMSLND